MGTSKLRLIVTGSTILMGMYRDVRKKKFNRKLMDYSDPTHLNPNTKICVPFCVPNCWIFRSAGFDEGHW
jgi:hypothetical protein